MQGELRIDDGRRITAKQRKAIYATIRDIAVWSGDSPEWLKDMLKCDYVANTGEPWFSLSNCSVTVGRDFLNYLLDFVLTWGVPLSERAVERTDDIDTYLYCCLKHHKCAVCGREGEIHHVDTIGMGANRKTQDDSEKRKICLCRDHHQESHRIGQISFELKYHVKGIKFTEN
jgi:hypothetical protein